MILHRCVFGLLAIIGICQIIAGVLNHSSLLQMSLAATLLVTISLSEKIVVFSHNGSALLFRVAALVVYIAMLFINLSHCLEELTDFGNREEDHAEHEKEDHQHGVIPHSLFMLAIGDFCIKAIFCLLVSPLSIARRWQNMVVVMLPAMSTIAIVLYKRWENPVLGDWIEKHLEAMVATVLTIVSYSIIFPSIHHMKPFLLADSPPLEQFDLSDIEKKVKGKVDTLENVSHVHASQEWPAGFKVTMKAQIRITKTDPEWVVKAADAFKVCKKELHGLIKEAGANKVVIEPVFIDPTEKSDDRNNAICIDYSCHSKDVGCCTVRKEKENPKCSAESPV